MNDETLKQAFKQFDYDGDGKIGSADWKKIFEFFNERNEFELEALDFDEFKQIANESLSDENANNKAIEDLFKLLDAGGKGNLDASDLHSVTSKFNLSLTQSDIKDVISSMTDGKETVDVNHFKDACKK